MNVAKPVHVVIWGASGFAGRLVAEHCARDYSNGHVKWAIAGRSQQKLESLRSELANMYGDSVNSVPILVGDIHDPPSLDAIASQTNVIISTAGPFSKIGTPVVEAALRNGTHYCDITGEVPWVKDMIDQHHEEAEKKKIRIVPCCGYDSVPSDLGSWFIVNEMKKRFGKMPVKMESIVVGAKGGASGGTIASGMYLAEQQAKRSAQGITDDLSSPYYLIPDGMEHGTDHDRWFQVEMSTLTQKWLGPFIMQLCNSRIVHRSNYLLGWGGPKFHYEEAVGASSWMQAKLTAIGTIIAVLAISKTWMHPLLRKILPAPGEGPSRENMLSGFWKHRIAGVSEDGDVIVAELGDKNRDPGYWGTSRMLLEAGLTLALQQDELDASSEVLHGGVLTSASALGETFLKRLRDAGLYFEVTETKPAKVSSSDQHVQPASAIQG